MRHPIRSAVVATASALLLTSGTGTAAAQGSLEFALPFLSIPGLSSLGSVLDPAAGPGAPGDPAANPAAAAAAAADDLLPSEVRAMAFEGAVVAAVNEARLVVGADRLITDPQLEASARERAAELAAGDPTTGDLVVPEGARTGDPAGAENAHAGDPTESEGAEADDRTVLLPLPAGSTPQDALAQLLGDTGMRERMLDGQFARVGVGVAVANDGTVYVVQDFARD